VRDGEGFGALALRLGLSRKTIYRHWKIILRDLRLSFGLPADQSVGSPFASGHRADRRTLRGFHSPSRPYQRGWPSPRRSRES
jgi:hypothetical protein